MSIEYRRNPKVPKRSTEAETGKSAERGIEGSQKGTVRLPKGGVEGSRNRDEESQKEIEEPQKKVEKLQNEIELARKWAEWKEERTKKLPKGIEGSHRREISPIPAHPTEQRSSIAVGENTITIAESSITTEGNSFTIVLQLENEPEPPLDQEIAEAFRETIEGLQHIIDKMAGRDPQEVSIRSVTRNSPISITIGFDGYPDEAPEVIQVLKEILVGVILSSLGVGPVKVASAFFKHKYPQLSEEEICVAVEEFLSSLNSDCGAILAQTVKVWAEASHPQAEKKCSTEYNIWVIRELLGNAFNLKDLKRFLQDRSDFRPILSRFGPYSSLADMIDIVIEYCQLWCLFPELLEEIEDYNPRQYDRFKDGLYRKPRLQNQWSTFFHPAHVD